VGAQEGLRALRKQLELLVEQGASAHRDATRLVRCLLGSGVPDNLVAQLGTLPFEAQKDVARAFGAVLRLGTQLGLEAEIAGSLRSGPCLQALVEGVGRAETTTHCGPMLRSCARCPPLAAGLLEEGAAARLVGLAGHAHFDVASEAFCSLRELLTAPKAVSAPFLEANFDEFFGCFHALVESECYVSQRQALRLLGDVLLDRSFAEVMGRYASSMHFLRVHMELLRKGSGAIQVDAFHIFKIFAANPAKPRRMHQVLYQNRARLAKLLGGLHVRCTDDDALAGDLGAVLGILSQLEAPPRLLVAVHECRRGSQS